MKLSPKERAEIRESFRQMSPAKKLEYIFSYYKLPIVLAVVALIVVGDFTYRHFTKKEALLYVAYFNVSMGEELNTALTAGFVDYAGASAAKQEVYVYPDLYLAQNPSTDNHPYAYASQLKLLAAIEAKKLDIVLMNQEAYDILSQNEYLYAIPDILEKNEPLYLLLEPYLTTNTVILEDNSIEYTLNEADTYEAVTAQAVNGINVSSFPLFQDAGFSGSVYLGVIANSPRLSTVFQYMEYLAAA